MMPDKLMGKTFTARVLDRRRDKGYINVKWKIIRLYPNMVMAVDAEGNKECFGIGDLVMAGLLPSQAEGR